MVCHELTNRRVIIYELVNFLWSLCEASYSLPRVDDLLAICDDPLLYQLDDSIPKHLRMDSKVAVILELIKNRVGDWSSRREIETWDKINPTCLSLKQFGSSIIVWVTALWCRSTARPAHNTPPPLSLLYVSSISAPNIKLYAN